MIVKTCGPGLRLEKENEQFFWSRDNERSQEFISYDLAFNALRTRGVIRWTKVKKEIECQVKT